MVSFPSLALLIQNRPVKGLARGSGPAVRRTRVGLQAGHGLVGSKSQFPHLYDGHNKDVGGD